MDKWRECSWVKMRQQTRDKPNIWTGHFLRTLLGLRGKRATLDAEDEAG
jgi:hypothetical protein